MLSNGIRPSQQERRRVFFAASGQAHGLQVWPLKSCCACKSLSPQNNPAINQKVEWNNFATVIEQVWLGWERKRERTMGAGKRSQATFSWFSHWHWGSFVFLHQSKQEDSSLESSIKIHLEIRKNCHIIHHRQQPLFLESKSQILNREIDF